MKTLVKKHMIGLFALVLTVATMSFKMVEKSQSRSSDWYSVGAPEAGGRPINPTPMPNPEPGCHIDITSNICAVELDSPPPAYFEDLTGSPRVAGRE